MATRLTSKWLCAPALLLAMAGCRGNPSDSPPIHWQRNMFTQDKAKSQRENTFFEDHRSMRPLVEGTLSQDAPVEVTSFYTGKDEKDAPIVQFPKEVNVTVDFVKRGQQRYGIYCAPCHGQAGYGDGAVIERANKYGRWVPTSYYDETVMKRPVGELFGIVSNGIRTMPSYAYQIPVADRWAIVAYVRALQKSQRATLADVPESERNNLR